MFIANKDLDYQHGTCSSEPRWERSKNKAYEEVKVQVYVCVRYAWQPSENCIVTVEFAKKDKEIKKRVGVCLHGNSSEVMGRRTEKQAAINL